VIVCVCVCLGPFFIVWSIVNSVAWAYGSTQALPWGTVLLLGTLWAIRMYTTVSCSQNLHLSNFIVNPLLSF